MKPVYVLQRINDTKVSMDLSYSDRGARLAPLTFLPEILKVEGNHWTATP